MTERQYDSFKHLPNKSTANKDTTPSPLKENQEKKLAYTDIFDYDYNKDGTILEIIKKLDQFHLQDRQRIITFLIKTELEKRKYLNSYDIDTPFLWITKIPPNIGIDLGATITSLKQLLTSYYGEVDGDRVFKNFIIYTGSAGSLPLPSKEILGATLSCLEGGRIESVFRSPKIVAQLSKTDKQKVVAQLIALAKNPNYIDNALEKLLMQVFFYPEWNMSRKLNEEELAKKRELQEENMRVWGSYAGKLLISILERGNSSEISILKSCLEKSELQRQAFTKAFKDFMSMEEKQKIEKLFKMRGINFIYT